MFFESDGAIRRAWAWISAAFAFQAAGSLLVQHLFRMDFNDICIPVSLLALGAVLGLLFMRFPLSGKRGSWQWWVPALLYALFIFALSDRSYPQAEPTFDTKFFHPLEYMGLTLCLCLGWSPTLGSKGVVPFAMRVAITGLLLAASDELHQAFIPGRTSRLADVLFWDLPAILTALAGVLAILRFFSAIPPRNSDLR